MNCKKCPTLPEITQSVCYIYCPTLPEANCPYRNIMPSGKVGQIVIVRFLHN